MNDVAPGVSRLTRDGTALAHLPIGLFGAVMAFAGLALAWQEAVPLFGAPPELGAAVLSLAVVAFLFLTAAYLRKMLRHPAAVRAEFAHPVSIAFFSMPTIGLILIAAGILPYARGLANAAWLIGAVGTFVLMIVILRYWLTQRPDIRHVNPSWFVPVVCNALTPVAGVPLGHTELSWLAFAAASLFGVVLFTIVCYRLAFHEGLPVPLVPTLVILVAPTALEFSGYTALTGTVDDVARMLFCGTLTMVIIVATMVPIFVDLPFGPSWWAFTFPLDAVAIAAEHYCAAVGGLALRLVAGSLLAVATVLVGLVAVRTTRAALRGTLLKPS